MECTQKVGISGNLYLWNGITRSNPWIGDGNDPRLGLTSLRYGVLDYSINRPLYSVRLAYNTYVIVTNAEN